MRHGPLSVTQARARFSEILVKVEGGQEVTITRRGVPIVRLSGVRRPKRPLNLAAIDAFRKTLKPTRQLSQDLIRRMRDESF
jgi:prevent-host-death family protein